MQSVSTLARDKCLWPYLQGNENPVRVPMVALDSTGMYWIEILERRGIRHF